MHILTSLRSPKWESWFPLCKEGPLQASPLSPMWVLGMALKYWTLTSSPGGKCLVPLSCLTAQQKCSSDRQCLICSHPQDIEAENSEGRKMEKIPKTDRVRQQQGKDWQPLPTPASFHQGRMLRKAGVIGTWKRLVLSGHSSGIMSPRNDGKTSPMIPQQYGCLHKTWTVTSTDMLLWKRRHLMGFLDKEWQVTNGRWGEN